MSRSTYYNYKSRIKRSVKIPGDECNAVKHVFDGCLCVTRIRILVPSFVNLTRHHTRVIKPLRRSPRARGQCWITICAFNSESIPRPPRISGGGEIERRQNKTRDKMWLIKLNDESSL